MSSITLVLLKLVALQKMIIELNQITKSSNNHE